MDLTPYLDAGWRDNFAAGTFDQPDQVAGREYAGKVEIIDFEEGYSTTGLVERIAAMAKAGKL